MTSLSGTRTAPDLEAPRPPVDLAAYVGDRHAEDPVESYVSTGAAIREHLERLLPQGFDLEGKTVLDFGCGSGRVLRHFLGEARAGAARFFGSDIDEPSVRWLREHLSPPFEVALTGEEPPLPFESGSFDLIWTTSVFTHLTDHWAGWLLELHRVLAPGGILIATIMSSAYNDTVTDVPWDEDRVGMKVLGYGAPWHAGGPMVLHSEWWLRAHWGRAFEILHFQPGGFGSPATGPSQGVAVMRRREVALTVSDLEALEPEEPREVAALIDALRSTQRERAHLNAEHDRYCIAYQEGSKQLWALDREVRELRALAWRRRSRVAGTALRLRAGLRRRLGPRAR
ncbi:MAG: class I SAM-dependent methyltransferase [Solirubrobacteraceae bacterium]